MSRRIFSLAALWAALAGTSLSLAQETSSPPQGRQFALLIGVAKYKADQLAPLPHAERDVAELAEVLENSGYPRENVVLMTLGKGVQDPRFFPSSSNISDEFTRLMNTLRTEDSLLLVLSGRSVQFSGNSAVFFCPADGTLDNQKTLVHLERLYAALKAHCKAETKVILADICHAEAPDDGADAGDNALELAARPQNIAAPDDLAVLFSSSGGEQAHRHDDFNQSVFFHYVIEGLRGAADIDGDQGVSLRELDYYVSPKVQSFVHTRLDARQFPQRQGDPRGLGLLAKVAPGAAESVTATADPLTPAADRLAGRQPATPDATSDPLDAIPAAKPAAEADKSLIDTTAATADDPAADPLEPAATEQPQTSAPQKPAPPTDDPQDGQSQPPTPPQPDTDESEDDGPAAPKTPQPAASADDQPRPPIPPNPSQPDADANEQTEPKQPQPSTPADSSTDAESDDAPAESADAPTDPDEEAPAASDEEAPADEASASDE